MHTRLGLGTVLLATGLALGCARDDGEGRPVPAPEDGRASRHDRVFRELVDEVDEAAEVLHRVHDEPSAREQAPRLERVARRMERTLKRLHDLEQPSRARQERVITQHYRPLQQAFQRLVGESERVGKIPGAAAALQEAARRFQQIEQVIKTMPPPAKR
jgi:hypothetical protein